MSLFISDAWAQAAPAAAQPGLLEALLPFIILFVVFYFLLIRPQSKRAKEHKSMLEALREGDEVVSNGGLLGRVTQLGENFVELDLGNEVRVKLQRGSIATVMPKGTLDSI